MTTLYELHLAKAEEFLSEENHQAAQAALEHALAAPCPSGDIRAKELMAYTLRALEFDDEAFELFSELVDVSSSPRVYAEYAIMLAERGRADDDCRSLAERAIDIDPESAYIAPAHEALYFVFAKTGHYVEALQHLKCAIRRGSDFPEERVFEHVRNWCQDLCSSDAAAEALTITTEVANFFTGLEFSVLHARIAEVCGEERIAVAYYKKALAKLKPGPLRSDILEALATIAI